jgi:hypothetical protein
VRASQLGWWLLRNNSGALPGANGRLIRFGLGAESVVLTRKMKSSDLVGIGPDGRFMAVECKWPGWKWTGDEHERAQFVFILQVLMRGGLAGFVRSANDMEALAARSKRLQGTAWKNGVA